MSKIFLFFKTIKTRGLSQTLSALFYFFFCKVLLILGKKFYKKNIFNYKLKLDLSDPGISRTLLLFGKRELEHKLILEEVVKEHMNILDIGANIGYYAIMQLKLLKGTGSLIAVEPSQKNIDLLKENLFINNFSNNVEIHNKAISDINGKRPFFISNHSNLNTFHNTGSGKKFLDGKKVLVETSTIENIIGKRELDLIRMDVEGHEVKILNNLLKLVKKRKIYPTVIFETHLSRYDSKKNNMCECLKSLFKNNYHVSIAGTSSKRGNKILKELGYDLSHMIRSDDDERSIVRNIKHKDALNLICISGGLRTVTLSKKIL